MKALATLALLSALALAGCSGSGGDATVPDQDADGNYVIHLTSANRFAPMAAKIPAGSNVTWVNDGGVHDVTAEDGSWSSDDSGTGLGHKMQAGDRFTREFSSPGTYEYHCELHRSAGMKGSIVVE